METERYKPRACLRPTHGPTRPELDRAGATRDTSAEQLRKREGSLACGVYTVLSSLYAVRNWKIDSVQQAHIKNARNWLAAVGHAIKEVVGLHSCGCGESYEQWGS